MKHQLRRAFNLGEKEKPFFSLPAAAAACDRGLAEQMNIFEVKSRCVSCTPVHQLADR
jgi:hypothetical protein